MKKTKKLGKILKSMAITATWMVSALVSFSIQAKEKVTRETFDYEQYADKYPDIKDTIGYDPDLLWNHYEQFGKQEGRFPGITPAAFLTVRNFDAKKYAAAYPDIAAVCGTNANALLTHYLQYGFREGREAFGLDNTTTAKLAAWQIAHEITTTEMSDFEKVKAVHDWIVNETCYDYDNFLKDTIPDSSYKIEGVMLNKTAVCSGYADTFQYFMDVLGIDCETIGGVALDSSGAEGGGHAWNQVCIEGQWYNIDVTWDDPVTEDGNPYLRYSYFLIDDDRFHERHVADPGEKEHICPFGYCAYVSETRGGNVYIGNICNGLKNGKGIMYYADGAQYEGNWVNDKREGFGTLLWSNGARYEGNWIDNKREGFGILYYSNQDRYEGEWVDNKMEGKGTYFWINGSRYEGEWVNNKMEGSGTIYYKNGTSLSGIWKDDVRQE